MAEMEFPEQEWVGGPEWFVFGGQIKAFNFPSVRLGRDVTVVVVVMALEYAALRNSEFDCAQQKSPLISFATSGLLRASTDISIELFKMATRWVSVA